MMFQWLSDLLQIFAEFIPRPIIVRTDEEMIEFRFGRWPRKLEAGWYVEWPAFAQCEKVPIKRDFVSRGQKFYRNGRTYAYTWKLVYDVTDSMRMVTECYNYTDTIADLTEMTFANMFERVGPTEILSRKSQGEIRSHAQSDLSQFGIRARRFKITSFSVVNPISIWEIENAAQILEVLK